MAVLIKKNIREILEDKDPNWAGFETGAVGAFKAQAELWMTEVVANVLGATVSQFADLGTSYLMDSIVGSGRTSQGPALGDENKKGGGIFEYGRDWDSGGRREKPPEVKDFWSDFKVPSIRINAVLEERSYLDFYFPNQAAGAPVIRPKKGTSIFTASGKAKVNFGIGSLSLPGLGTDFSEDRLDYSPEGRRRVAFFENPSIREDRTARYATQAIVARNEPARLYVGSEARKLKLDFTFTLPHVEYFFEMAFLQGLQGFGSPALTNLSYEDYSKYTKAHLDKFFGSYFATAPIGDPVTAAAATASVDAARAALGLFGARQLPPPREKLANERDFHATYVKNTGPKTTSPGYGNKGPRAYDPLWQNPQDGYEVFNPETRLNEIRHTGALSRNMFHLSKESIGMMATYYTQFVIDTIRASVVGDTTKLGPQGPPIVRFRNGTNFREESYIVKNYSITYPSDKGYEYRTLIPRQVKFSLSLEEFNQTHGSHHGGTTNQVPDGLDILSLIDFD